MRVILYTKDFNEKINENVDIILSPQFYWIKKIDIPIKSLKDAKKIARSMFKLNDDYIFDAFELDNKYFAYAIQKNLPLNINKKYINSIRLAQTELYEFDCLNVSKNHSIQKVEDLLFCFPYSENAKNIQEILPEIKLSKHKINLYDQLNIDKNILILIFGIFIFFNTGLFLNFIQNKISVHKLEKQRINLAKKYHLPKTTFQLNSILDSLIQTDTVQKNIRKNLEFITRTPLKKGEKFILLSYGNKAFEIEIKTRRNFDFYFKRRFKVNSLLKNSVYKATLYE